MAKEIREEELKDDDLLDTDDGDTGGQSVDVFEMSDEDFLEADDKGELDPPKDEDEGTDGDQKDEEDKQVTDSNEEDNSSDEDTDGDSHSSDEAGEDETDTADDKQQSTDETEKKSDQTISQKTRKKRHSQDRSLSPEEQEALNRNIADQTKDLTDEDYKNAYKELLKPIWARGHNFTPRNIEEVKTLMSQGVDYLYKTQQLAKSRKQVELLQRENISDEDLTFLIDLKKGNPEAVKKFFSDTKLNPYDIDTTEAPNYQPQTHMIDDATLALRDSVNNLMSKPDGKACYDELVNTLDVESQNHFLKEPDLLDTFYQHQHITVGNNKSLYTLIKEEIDHAKALGQLPQSMTFLDAYRTVGDRLFRVNDQAGSQPSYNSNFRSAQAPEVHQRLGSVQHRANTNVKLRSAGVSPKTKANRSVQQVNPFDMPDDEFLKQFDGRL